MGTPSLEAGEFRKETSRDARMIDISSSCNIAQFVSFDEFSKVRFVKLASREIEGRASDDLSQVLAELFRASNSNLINLRFFHPGTSTGAVIVRDIESVDEALQISKSKMVSGGYAIASEVLELADGGVSGVLAGGTVEFLMGVTPRFVDQVDGGFPQLPSAVGERLLRSIYGDHVELSKFEPSMRVEFSIHPYDVGHMGRRMIVWDVYRLANPSRLKPIISWPNLFSEWIGDKLYGQLLASSLGLPVPRSIAWLHPFVAADSANPIERWIPPEGIAFGENTGTSEFWMRSCPSLRRPGLYPTIRGRVDPTNWMLGIDPLGTEIRSCLEQQHVGAQFSGAAFCGDQSPLIEGIAGTGEQYMLGLCAPETLPITVQRTVACLAEEVSSMFGRSRLEWVFDGDRAWVVQINQIAGERREAISHEVPNEEYIDYDPIAGLAELQEIIDYAKIRGCGVRLARAVGLTSHVCELLNNAEVPYVVRRRLKPQVG
ncbi:hypothetical protein AB7M42_008957 [Bradyrhizobium diazoefficiens]